MSARSWRVLVIAVVLVGVASAAQGQNNSPVSVPDGTTVMPPKYAEDQPALDLKPEEQCLDKDSGVGRL